MDFHGEVEGTEGRDVGVAEWRAEKFTYLFVKYVFPFFNPIFKDCFDFGLDEFDVSGVDSLVGVGVTKMVAEGKFDVVGRFDACGTHVFVALNDE